MKNVVSKLIKKWYIYLAIVAVAIVSSIYYCNFINMPRNEETISLFVSSNDTSTEKLSNYLKEKSPDYLREINITNQKKSSGNFGYFFVNKGLNQADIFILHESYLSTDLLNEQFADLSSNCPASLSTYEKDSSNHGFLIHKKDNSNNDLLTFKIDGEEDENYYLFFRKNSLHIGELNDSKYDTAIRFAEALLSYE